MYKCPKILLFLVALYYCKLRKHYLNSICGKNPNKNIFKTCTELVVVRHRSDPAGQYLDR